MPADMMKITPDVGTIFANLNSAGVQGAMKDYCMARINGDPVVPELAKAAFMDAKKLVDSAAGKMDVDVGFGHTVAVDILEALMTDINTYAKFAASREKMLRLANKFAKLIK